MRPPGWEIEYRPALHGYVVSVRGQIITNENGEPAVYWPPASTKSDAGFRAWRDQLCRSIARMSGLPCDPQLE